LAPPAPDPVSSCELPAPRSGKEQAKGSEPAEARELLAFCESFQWEGRPPAVYKADQALPFRGVARHELIGGGSEQTAFDLRYFEVQPGGFTSLEKHQHTHTIICIRGAGVLLRGERRQPLRRLDIAYIGPLEPHQLRNETSEPFGFFCIVDRDRDRPLPA